MFKKILKIIAIVIVAVVVAASGYVAYEVHAFDTSMAKEYQAPLPSVARTTDATALARGKHLAESLGGCASKDCHGSDFGGGNTMEMGPLGTIAGPNLTGQLAKYSDGELARLLLTGVKRNGTSVRFMDVKEFNWLSDADLSALISYLRTVPPVQRADGPMDLGVVAKVLDRRDMLPLDIARRTAGSARDIAPPAAPTAEYGAYVIRACRGCHGEHLSGGAIPGAPPSLPVPKNLTLHETGLKGWSYADFDKLLTQGVSKDGKKLDPFMPLDLLKNLTETEKQAMWAYLEKQPPLDFGGR